MKYTTLGNTEIKVSKICLGTMTFGNQNTEAEGHEQMDYALANGVNFFDTAELYAVPSTAEVQGKTEKIIGTWFKKSGKRKEVFLATKITGPSPNLSFIRPELNFSKEQIHTALEGSFKRLQTDYVDLYQLHWPERRANFFGKLGYKHSESDPWEDNFAEVIDTLDDLVKEGKIRTYGISNETPWGVMRHLQEGKRNRNIRPQSIQNPYSLLNRSFEVGLAEMAIREKVGLLAYSPMAFGLLSGKYHKKIDKPSDRLNTFKVMSRYSSDNCYKATEEYLKIAENNGLSLAEMSLAFVTDQPFVTSNIIGATSIDQLKENIGSAAITLSSEILAEIDKVHGVISNPAP